MDSSPLRRSYRSILIFALAVALIGVAYPLYVIRPFRHQGARELAVALAVLRFRFPIAVLCGAASAYAAFLLRGRWPAVAAGFTLLLAIAANINLFEILFHPNRNPTFVAASASKLSGKEKVIAISLGTKSRAYPIRSIGYHHVINDVVGGVPIVATY